MEELNTKSPQETQKFAQKIAAKLDPGATILLHGDLGSGKTVFSKALALHFGIPEKSIKSPTYTILREYELHNKEAKKLVHIDLYRLNEVDDITLDTIEQHFNSPTTITIVEWAERLNEDQPKSAHHIHLSYQGANQRLITWKHD